MGDRKFTLIELHLDGEAQFGPRRIGEALPMLGRDVDVDTATEPAGDVDEEEPSDEESSRGKPIGLVVGLVALVGIALAVRKFRGDDEDDEFETSRPVDERDVVID